MLSPRRWLPEDSVDEKASIVQDRSGPVSARLKSELEKMEKLEKSKRLSERSSDTPSFEEDSQGRSVSLWRTMIYTRKMMSRVKLNVVLLEFRMN